MNEFQYVLYALILVAGVYAAARVAGIAWFSAKFEYHKRLTRYVTEGDDADD